MVKALLFVILGVCFIALGVYLLMSREKINQVNLQLKQNQKEISQLSYIFDDVKQQLAAIEKPLSTVHKFSSRVVYYMKNKE